jgi:hypothetical protein
MHEHKMQNGPDWKSNFASIKDKEYVFDFEEV